MTHDDNWLKNELLAYCLAEHGFYAGGMDLCPYCRVTLQAIRDEKARQVWIQVRKHMEAIQRLSWPGEEWK